jgi:hypothetical protein
MILRRCEKAERLAVKEAAPGISLAAIFFGEVDDQHRKGALGGNHPAKRGKSWAMKKNPRHGHLKGMCTEVP